HAREEALHHLEEQEREIAEAKAIQEKLLPREIPQLAGYEIASSWQSAGTVGGDYFDLLPLGTNALGVCIVAVAGIGIQAELVLVDQVVLFTDGETEACNSDGEELGDARLLALLQEHRALPAADIQRKIVAAISEFSGGHRTDDATLLVLSVGA